MIHLTSDQQKLIDAQIATGQFKGPSDVINAALALLEMRQAEYDELQVAIAEIERGDYSQFDVAAIKTEMHRRLNQRDVPF